MKPYTRSQGKAPMAYATGISPNKEAKKQLQFQDYFKYHEDIGEYERIHGPNSGNFISPEIWDSLGRGVANLPPPTSPEAIHIAEATHYPLTPQQQRAKISLMIPSSEDIRLEGPGVGKKGSSSSAERQGAVSSISQWLKGEPAQLKRESESHRGMTSISLQPNQQGPSSQSSGRYGSSLVGPMDPGEKAKIEASEQAAMKRAYKRSLPYKARKTYQSVSNYVSGAASNMSSYYQNFSASNTVASAVGLPRTSGLSSGIEHGAEEKLKAMGYDLSEEGEAVGNYDEPSWGREERGGESSAMGEQGIGGSFQGMAGPLEKQIMDINQKFSTHQKYGAATIGAAALTGLAAWGIHKAWKSYKRKRGNNTITSEAGSGNSGGQGPSTNDPGTGSENLSAAPTLGGGAGSGPAGSGESAGGPSEAGAGAGAGASAGGAPPPHPGGGGGGAGQPVLVNAVDENGAPLFPQKESSGPNEDRTDPITPATGSKQTVATANSIQGPEVLQEMAAKKVAEEGPEAVHGNARERANMGKGALDSYSFNGPYDYPIYPGGRPDDTLTLMGAWRTTRGGNGSSLWYSKKTAKGANAKRNKYYKWSTKGGGNWRKLTKDEMVNVFQKRTGAEGGNFYGVPAGSRFADLISQQVREKEKDIALGRAGAQIQQNRKMGFAGGQARKKRRVEYGCGADYSAHN